MLTNTNATAEHANSLLQPIVLPHVVESSTPRLERKHGAPFVVRDRVVSVETVESGDMRIYNGTLGTIVSLDLEEKTFVVQFDDNKSHTYNGSTHMVKHSYCLTIHRSQGSEYQNVASIFAMGSF